MHFIRKWDIKIFDITFSVLFCLLLTQAATAHRSGCHRWHSCPSDRGTYTCGDTGHCNYCPNNYYCKDGRPKAFDEREKAKENKQKSKARG